jgi:hypothetical protein
MDCPSCGKFVLASIAFFHDHHKFVKIVNSQLAALEISQNSNYAENSFSLDLGPKNPQYLLNHNRYI